jgi:hypothetical protein
VPLLRRGGMDTYERVKTATRLLEAAGRLGDVGLANDVLSVMAGSGGSGLGDGGDGGGIPARMHWIIVEDALLGAVSALGWQAVGGWVLAVMEENKRKVREGRAYQGEL